MILCSRLQEWPQSKTTAVPHPEFLPLHAWQLPLFYTSNQGIWQGVPQCFLSISKCLHIYTIPLSQSVSSHQTFWKDILMGHLHQLTALWLYVHLFGFRPAPHLEPFSQHSLTSTLRGSYSPAQLHLTHQRADPTWLQFSLPWASVTKPFPGTPSHYSITFLCIYPIKKVII